MQQRTVVQLAQALTESERRELVERIQRSLNIARKDEEPIYHAPVNRDYRDRMIQHDMQEMGFIQRVVLWFRRLVSGKSDVDTFLALKLGQMARILETRHLVDASARSLQPGLGDLTVRLHARVAELSDFFRFLWASDRNLMRAVQTVLAARIPQARATLADFIPPAELEQLFETSESKSSIRQELLDRVHSYLDRIPTDVFSRIEEGLLPLYHLKELAGMDFSALLSAFRTGSGGDGKKDLRSVPADRFLDDLERLYFAVHTAMKGGSGDSLHQEIFDLYRNAPALREEEKSPPDAPEVPEGLEPLPDEPVAAKEESADEKALRVAAEARKEDGDANLRRLVKDLAKEAGTFAEASCLGDVIRYFRGDPYYKFIAYVPSLNIKEFYLASTRMKVLEELDATYTALREGIVNRIRNTLFGQGRFREFEHYRKVPHGLGRAGLPSFRYVDSLALLNNFVHGLYLPHMRELLKTLTKALPSRSRDSQGEFHFHMNGLESVHERIKALDLSFAPENAEGKNLLRLRSNMERDPSQDRAYRIWVIQKEKDIKPVLEEGVEHLRALADLLDEVLKLPDAMIDERFQHVLGVSTQGGYHNRFKGFARDTRSILQAVRYQRTLEEEML